MTHKRFIDIEQNKVAATCNDYDIGQYRDKADMDYRNSSSLEYQMWICNLTNEDIVVRDRLGVEVFIKPSNVEFGGRHFREVAIFEEHKYQAGADPVSRDMWDRHVQTEKPTYSSVMRDGIDKVNHDRANGEGQRYRYTNRQDRISTKQVISRDTLAANGGGLYVASIDRVIYLSSCGRTFHHPYSEEAMILKKQNNKGFGSSFEYDIVIRDRLGTVGNRWINISGEAFLIVAKTEASEDDGITLTYRTGTETSTKTMSLEEGVKTLKLYRTREDALTLGDSLASMQKEIERLKLETSQQNAKNKHKEQMYEEVKSERDYENFKARSEAERDSVRRKNFHEVLKLAPVVLSTILTLIVIIRKA